MCNMHTNTGDKFALVERICLRPVVSWLLVLALTQDFQLRLNTNNTCDCQLLYHHVCQTKQSSFWSTALCYIKVLMAASSSLNCCKHPCQWTVSSLQQSVGKLTRSGGGSFPAQRWHLASARLQRQQAGIQMYGWRDRVEHGKRSSVGRKTGKTHGNRMEASEGDPSTSNNSPVDS